MHKIDYIILLLLQGFSLVCQCLCCMKSSKTTLTKSCAKYRELFKCNTGKLMKTSWKRFHCPKTSKRRLSRQVCCFLCYRTSCWLSHFCKCLVCNAWKIGCSLCSYDGFILGRYISSRSSCMSVRCRLTVTRI